jgi:competence protein ComEC
MKLGILFRWVGGLILAAVACVWWQWPDTRLHIVACDVGQGDATLVTQGFTQVLIDGGPENQKVLTCLSHHMPFWDRQIELVMISHPQADHIGGLVEVFKRYRVVNLAAPITGVNSTVFKNLYLEVKQQQTLVEVADNTKQLKLGGVNYHIVWPPKVEGSQSVWAFPDLGSQDLLNVTDPRINDQSLVVALSYGQLKMLFAGDIEAKTEGELLMQKRVNPVSNIKVAHHGSKTSSTDGFLRAAVPDLAIIEVGKGNTYGHPNREVLD